MNISNALDSLQRLENNEKPKKLTYEEFGRLLHTSLELHYYNGIRLGQALFSVAVNRFPQFEVLKGTGADCSYQDSKIIHFIDAILEK